MSGQLPDSGLSIVVQLAIVAPKGNKREIKGIYQRGFIKEAERA
jgi:hypothetical protein